MARKPPAPEAPPPAPMPPPELGLQDALMAMNEEPTELDKIMALMLDPKNIQHNTELSKNEITAFSVLSTMAKRHKLPVLEDFLQYNLVMRVSKGRQGRKEWVKMLARHLSQTDEAAADAQRAGRGWFGRRR